MTTPARRRDAEAAAHAWAIQEARLSREPIAFELIEPGSRIAEAVAWAGSGELGRQLYGHRATGVFDPIFVAGTIRTGGGGQRLRSIFDKED